MPIVRLIAELVLIGVIMWLVDVYAPMPAAYKRLVQIVVIVLVIVWLATVFGLLPSDATVPRLRQ
jgi:hypothetical protein